MLAFLLAPLVGALGNRLRGGLLPIPGGTQVGRLAGWGLPMGLLAYLAGASPLLASLVGLLAFAGCCIGQYGGLSMGHRGDPPKVSPWLTMTAWGIARTLPAGLAVAWFQGEPLAALVAALGGLLCAPLYDLAWRVPSWAYLKGLGYGDGPATGYDPPELAEALHGAAMALALVGALHVAR